MKAIDDEWEYQSGGWPYDVFRKGTNEKIADVWGYGTEDNHATADLIAAAPDMARLLKGAEFMPGDYYVIPREQVLAVLRKAGVIADKETR